jgi:ABC-type branched-subunit amino acid transport system substrate-binding protein
MPAAPATVTDYSPYVQALMTSADGGQPDVIFLVVAQNNVFGLGRALKQAGYNGIQTNAVSYAPQLTTLADGWSAFTQFATPESTSSEMSDIVATLAAGGIDEDQIGQPALAGYFSADMFVQILKKVGKNLTPENFQKKAAKIKYSIDNVIGPTVYPASFKAGAPCGQLATSDGTAWSVTAPFDCYDLLTKKGNKWVQVPYPKGVK